MKVPYSHKSDAWTALAVFGLVLFGIVMIYSASVVLGHTLYGDDTYFVKRQIVWAILGFVGMAVMANIEYRVWQRWAGVMLFVTLLLLVAVFLFSSGEINGAHRWIRVAGQTFQPSELAKLTFIIYASAWLMQRKKEIGDIWHTFVPYVAVLGIISVLMLKEPDFGTLSIIVVAAIAMYFVAGLTWQQVALGAVVLTVALAATTIGSTYRRQRLLTFLDPSQDTQGSAYHSQNISIAIGSGGWRGLGFGESKQKRLFLPEPHTDSIFAIICEELGMISGLVLIAAFLFLVFRGYLIAIGAPDLFGRLLASGITTWFAFQTFINLGSMVGLVPLVGVPLPFISYGGTNLLISLLASGLLLNISRFSRLPEEEKAGRQAAKRKR